MISCSEDGQLVVNDTLFKKEYKQYEKYKHFNQPDLGDKFIKKILENNKSTYDKFYMIAEIKKYYWKCENYVEFKSKIENNIQRYNTWNFKTIFEL